MVAVLLDPSYSNSVWCKKIYVSLTEQLRQKRIPFCEIYENCPASADAVFIIASDIGWMTATVKALNDGGVYPIILCNQAANIPGCIYNCVCSDIDASMRSVTKHLYSQNKKRIAVYGINPNSIADICRADSLMVCKDGYFETMRVFTNNGSLKECFDGFFKVSAEFDAVICANDLVAVSLVRNIKINDPSLFDKLSIISCAPSDIASFYRDRIKSLDISYEEYGKAALYLYDSIKKHSYLSGLTAKIVWSFDSEKQNTEKCDVLLNTNGGTDEFYSDEEMYEMLIVEKLLSLADDTDKIILRGLVNGLPYEKIAEECFLSEGSIKYRVKNLIAESGAKNKQTLILLLKKYLNGKEL